MRVAKSTHYADVLPELEVQNIDYLPATASCDGRRYPCVNRFLLQVSHAAARRKGLDSQIAFYRRWCREVASEVWRRAARMVRACMPRKPAVTEYQLAVGRVS